VKWKSGRFEQLLIKGRGGGKGRKKYRMNAFPIQVRK